MQTVLGTVASVVLGELVFLTGNGNLAVVDAVGVAAYRCTEVAGRVEGVGILGDVVVAEYHVGGIAILVGHHERHDAATIVGDAGFHAILVLQHVEFHGLVVDHGVEFRGVKIRGGQHGLFFGLACGKQGDSNACSQKNTLEVFHN